MKEGVKVRLSANRQLLIRKLMEHEPCGRAELARLTGLSKPTVAENIDPLVQAGMITEEGEGEAAVRGGRRPKLLRFNDRYRLIAVIDLSRRQPIVAVGDLRGKLLAKTSLAPTIHREKPKQKLRACTVTLGKQLAGLKRSAGPLGTVVLCIPGVYNSDNTLVRVHPDFAGWAEINLDRDLETVFEVPVMVKNDVWLSALGEFQLGSGQGCSSIAYVSSGMGVGAGLILNGVLHEGAHFAAGELDIIQTRSRMESGLSLQERIGMEFLLSRVRRDIAAGAASERMAALAGKGEARFQHLVECAHDGDEYVIGLIREIGRELGYVYSMIVALVDVERIVTGGDYMAFLPWMQPEVDRILSGMLPRTDLRPAALGEDSGVYGGIIYGRRYLWDDTKL